MHRSCVTTHPSARFGLWKNRAWNKAFCIARFSAAGIDDVFEFDDSNLKRNYENGSLLAGALNESFGTLDAEITPETNEFFVSDAEGDPDCPSKGYSSIEHALDALRHGKVCCFMCYGHSIAFLRDLFVTSVFIIIILLKNFS